MVDANNDGIDDNFERKVIVYALVGIIVLSLILNAVCNMDADSHAMIKDVITWCLSSLTTIMGVPKLMGK